VGPLLATRGLRVTAGVVFVLLGSTNAVNLTDGLDGLAIGCTIIAAGALTVLTYVTSHVVYADYLEIQRMPLVAELTVFCGSMVGASIGFLWYNAHPAEIFMGDVGSLALGGAIGTVAVIIRQELLLPFIGGIFIIEALSVLLQVGSYKFRNKKRIFKMAPLHHHFEQLGWSESKVIARFWILALIFALGLDSLGLPTLYWEKLPTIALSLAMAVVGICERNGPEIAVQEVHIQAREPFLQHS